jgi:hypothetical protein
MRFAAGKTQAPLCDQYLVRSDSDCQSGGKLGEAKMDVKPVLAASALAIGFGALWASPALTSGTAAAAAEEQPKAARSDPGRRVCRNLIRSGTRLSTRYCRTQAEWDEAGEGSRRFLQEGQNEGSSRDGEFHETRERVQEPRR